MSTGKFKNDRDTIAPAMESASNSVPAPPKQSTLPGVDPEMNTTLDFGNEQTQVLIEKVLADAKKAIQATEEFAATDEGNARNISAASPGDTELSSGGGGGSGGASMLMGPGSGVSGQPVMPPMQAMSAIPTMAQMPMQAMSAPMSALPQMPMQAMSGMAGYATPSGSPMSRFASSSSSGGGSSRGGTTSALVKALLENGVEKGKLHPSQVDFRKSGLGTLNSSQVQAVIDKALDLNGIPENSRVRSQWHEVMTFVAKHESAFNADAVNTYDTNARGRMVSDGNPAQCSRGIWQTIYTTFANHHVPGTSNSIYDPLASCAAAVRYIMDRYDVSPNGGSSLQTFYANRRNNGYTGY